MSKDKQKGFLLYTSYQSKVDKLTDKEAGILFKNIFRYISNSELENMNDKVDMAFCFIKDDIDRNNAEYAKTCEARRKAGSLGGAAKAAKKNAFTDIQESTVDFEELGKRVFKN